jgi:hypothetical protein
MYLGKVEGGSPRSQEVELEQDIKESFVIPPGIIKKVELEEEKEPEKPKEPEEPEVPSVTKSLPHAFRKGRKLTPKEIDYVKRIYGDSVRYDKVRITRDHWFAYGSTRVTGNTINFTSDYGGEYLFEDTPEQQLNEAGLKILGHEIGHVWQFQNGGWAYAGDSVAKQTAGHYATGSRNTAYDWQSAVDWDIPWKKWGPEQQAEVIDRWNLAKHHDNNEELAEKLFPFVEKARRGEGVVQFSIPGTVVCCLILSGVGYLIKKKKGAAYGAAAGFLINLPWNKWFLKKPRDLK